MFFWLQSLRLIVEVQFCHHSGFKRTLVFVLKRIQRMEMSLMLWLIFMCIHWVMVCTRLIKAYRLPGRRHASSYSACRQPTLQEKFELPYAWLRGSERDARETVLVPPEGTSVDVLFPGAVAPPQINELESGGLQWFSECVGVGNSFSPVRQAKDNPMNKLVSMDSLFELQRQATFVKLVRDALSLRGTQQIEIIRKCGEKSRCFRSDD